MVTGHLLSEPVSASLKWINCEESMGGWPWGESELLLAGVVIVEPVAAGGGIMLQVGRNSRHLLPLYSSPQMSLLSASSSSSAAAYFELFVYSRHCSKLFACSIASVIFQLHKARTIMAPFFQLIFPAEVNEAQ